MMNDHSEHNGFAAAKGQQPLLPDQVVLGHLLPHYQAARDWQDVVRVQRHLAGHVSEGQARGTLGIVSLLRDALRGWRSRRSGSPTIPRHGIGGWIRASTVPES